MTNTMTYEGYSARIEYDDDDGIFTGRIAGIRDGVGFMPIPSPICAKHFMRRSRITSIPARPSGNRRKKLTRAR